MERHRLNKLKKYKNLVKNSTEKVRYRNPITIYIYTFFLYSKSDIRSITLTYKRIMKIVDFMSC